MHDTELATLDDARLVATFHLGGAVFGVRAEEVQEVVRPGDITVVHHAPEHVLGIRNLRGRVVTVIDLAQLLDVGRGAIGPESRLLITDWQGEPVGLLVDQVADTISVGEGELAPAPPNVHGVQARNLRGVVRTAERLVAVLDPDAVLELEAG